MPQRALLQPPELRQHIPVPPIPGHLRARGQLVNYVQNPDSKSDFIRLRPQVAHDQLSPRYSLQDHEPPLPEGPSRGISAPNRFQYFDLLWVCVLLPTFYSRANYQL